MGPWPTIGLRRAVDRGLAGPLGELEFCVLDVETSGLDARRDRILEIAIVRVRGDGAVLDEYATLVSGSPVAATAVHGITECDLAGAPRFAQIAGDVRARLSAAVLAGHNVVFDLAFVSAAFARVGWPLSSRPWICTMALARLLEQTPGRIGLRAACEQQGLLVTAQHSALGDARAAGAAAAWPRGADTTALVTPSGRSRPRISEPSSSGSQGAKTVDRGGHAGHKTACNPAEAGERLVPRAYAPNVADVPVWYLAGGSRDGRLRAAALVPRSKAKRDNLYPKNNRAVALDGEHAGVSGASCWRIDSLP